MNRVLYYVSCFLTCISVCGALIVAGCSEGIPTRVEDAIDGEFGMLITGPSVRVDYNVAGGTDESVSVDDVASPLAGLRLTIPNGAYNAGRHWSISYAEIRSHRYTTLFRPVTPLIRIVNSGGFAARPLRLRIPIHLPESMLPVAFRYDKINGTLEALAPISRSTNAFEVMIRQSSEIVVSAISFSEIYSFGGYDIGFDPTYDGWSFVNEPTLTARSGISPGMSIGAAEYFERFRGVPLIGKAFDNVRYGFPTQDVWWDDATGIALCTNLQLLYESANASWVFGNGYSPQDPIWSVSAFDQFWTICYALMVTTRPQPLLTRVKNDPTKPVHVMLVHGWHIEEAFNLGRLLVYDPNNIHSKRNEIRFALESDEIGPFETAVSAEALSYGLITMYDIIRFVPLSTLCDPGDVRRVWENSMASPPPTGSFTPYEVFAKPVDSSAHSRVKLRDAASGEFTELPFAEFTLEIESADPALSLVPVVFIYAKDSGKSVPLPQQSKVSLSDLNGDNRVGVFATDQRPLMQFPWVESFWTGFRWYNIRFRPK